MRYKSTFQISFWLFSHAIYFSLYSFGIVSHIFLAFLIFHALFFVRSNKFICPSMFILANFSLYVALPSMLTTILFYIEYDYQLLWIENIAVKWASLSNFTILQTSFIFIFLYYPLVLFERRINLIRKFKFPQITQIANNQTKLVFNTMIITAVTSIFLTFYLFFSMGGPDAFFSDYSSTFLKNRSGLGVPIILGSIFTNICVFLLGIIFFSEKFEYRLLFLILALFIIFTNGFVMGFKSRIGILFIIFFLHKLMNFNFNFKVLVYSTALFFIALFSLSYVRTNGYYTGFLLIEMLISYFNNLILHETIVIDFKPMDLFSIFWGANKWLYEGGIINYVADYDYSIYLTKIYYPDEWFLQKATQQWPIQTEIYLNFGAGVFQIIPVFLISAYLVMLYVIYTRPYTNLAIIFICFSEFLRTLVTLRGGLLPYDLVYAVLAYIIYWIFLRRIRV